MTSCSDGVREGFVRRAFARAVVRPASFAIRDRQRSHVSRRGQGLSCLTRVDPVCWFADHPAAGLSTPAAEEPDREPGLRPKVSAGSDAAGSVTDKADPEGEDPDRAALLASDRSVQASIPVSLRKGGLILNRR
jgi:hypothetical protein